MCCVCMCCHCKNTTVKIPYEKKLNKCPQTKINKNLVAKFAFSNFIFKETHQHQQKLCPRQLYKTCCTSEYESCRQQ